MTIRFRCQNCHKEVEAPDSSAGRQGKCPYCGQTNYIASEVPEEELIPLAPIDETEERRRQEEIEALIAEEHELLKVSGEEPAAPLEHRENLASEDLHHFVVNYCLDMSNGNLKRAETYLQRLIRFMPTSISAVDDFLTGKASEKVLSAVPPEVLRGYLEKLKEKLK